MTVIRHRGAWVIVASLVLWWVLLYAVFGQADFWGPDTSSDSGANAAAAALRVMVVALAMAPAVLAGLGLVAIWLRLRRT